MIPEQRLLSRFRGGRVLLDTNLLLLLLIGAFERERIEKFKRTAGFTKFDYDQLVGFLRLFSKIVTTPHILTEVSNLAGALPDNVRESWSTHFARKAATFFEVFEESRLLMSGISFGAFGLTDAAIHSLAANTLILTEDFRLSGFLRSAKLPVFNFRELIQLSKVQMS